jgi:hypothetical protein|tara:strand:+ start:443 stop:997 length:555 start_codon:yes stop_codon:yes gene_type:complete
MKDDQLKLFMEEENIFKNIQTNTKPIDVAEIIPNHNIIKNQYFIYPTEGRHPFYGYHERLNTIDFPYILNTNYRDKGIAEHHHVVIRDTIEYPYVMLRTSDTTKRGGTRTCNICIHKLAARAFLNPGNLDPYDYDVTVVDHKDNKPWNYRLNNLRFVTRSENSKGARARTKEEIFKVGLLKGLF